MFGILEAMRPGPVRKATPLTINLLFGCCQIETSAHDLAATRRVMVDAFGAGPAEQSLAREIARIIPDPAYDVDHLECGEAIFQINQPSPSMTFNGQPSVHQSYLEQVGPCVTNLNFFIDDHAHAHALLTSMGAMTHIQGPSSVARALSDYGNDNSRKGADERPFLFMGTRALIGFDLEIMEPNFLRFTDQSVQYPAYIQPRPTTGDGNLHLERLIIVVDDLETTLDAVEAIFALACRSRAYAYRQGPLGRSFRMTLGGIEIEYCQSLSPGALSEARSRYGQGVVAIEFTARDLPRALGRVAAASTRVVRPDSDLLGDACHSLHYVECRALTGFDVVLGPPREQHFQSH